MYCCDDGHFNFRPHMEDGEEENTFCVSKQLRGSLRDS